MPVVVGVTAMLVPGHGHLLLGTAPASRSASEIKGSQRLGQAAPTLVDYEFLTSIRVVDL